MKLYKIVGVIVVLAVTFAAGRYSVNPPKIEEKSKETVTKDEKKDKEVQIKIVTIKEKRPDGTETETTTTEKEIKSQTESKQVGTKEASYSSSPVPRKTLNVSALVGTDVVGGTFGQPVYGAAVTKEFIGPVTGGAWALTNGTLGVSIGINF